MSEAVSVGPVAAGGDDLVALVTWVPAKHALEAQNAFQRLVSSLGATSKAGGYIPPHSNTYGGDNAWSLPEMTFPEDVPPVRWILSVLGSAQRRIVAGLVAAGPAGIWTGELRHLAGYDDAVGMAGVYKAIAGRFRRTGRQPVWLGGEKDSQKGQLLTVPDGDARAMFTTAFVEDYPDIAAEFGLT
ncbi:MAG: hypothetical protein JWN67_2938 [Actinomycetia bacterium]|nr:hypothetical protein [Actinomycetes bacterium]